MNDRDVYWEPPGKWWKMKIRDRLDFEASFNGLKGKERDKLAEDIQNTHPSIRPEEQADYLRDRTKHFWIVYYKWYNDFHALDLEEDLGTLSMVDSDSENEASERYQPPPRAALTPSDDERRYERMPAASDEPSDLDEQNEDGDDRMVLISPSPEQLARPHSPDLRAPSADITPATSSTPAVPTPRTRPAAVSTEGGPRKRRKDSNDNVPSTKKRRRDRPRAPRSKVKIARRKRRDVDPAELPENNAQHESFLYPYFRRPPPFDSKSRAVFALSKYELLDKSTNTLVSLLAIALNDSRSLQLEGSACALVEADGAEFHIVEGSRKVLVASHDILGLTLSLDGTYVETRLARYRLHIASADYDELAAQARRLQALYLFGRENRILGQNRKGTQRVINTLNETLVKRGRTPSSLEEKLHSSWWSEGLLSALDNSELDQDIAEILYRQLPNTPYVTPFVFDLVSRFLFYGMVRTDPHHDPLLGARQHAADEALLQSVQDEVLEFEEAAATTVEVPKTAQGRKYIDSKFVLQAGEPRTAITVYQEAIIDGELYRAGDTVLVLGESPLQASQNLSTSKEPKTASAKDKEGTIAEEGDVDAVSEKAPEREQEQSTSKKARVTGDDDEEYDANEGDVDAAFEKELRLEQASKPSTLSDVTLPWFGRIVYFFFKGKNRKQLYAHVDWFHHLRATPLGKVSHARGLVYADHCDAIPAETIIRHLDVTRVTADEIDIPREGFYYSLFWDKDSGAYVTADPLEDPDLADFTLLNAANAPRCLSCARRSTEVATSVEDSEPSKGEKDVRVEVPTWVSPQNSCDFKYEDIIYHLGDLVYITPAYTFSVKGDPLRQPFLLAELLAIDDVDDASMAASTPLTRVSNIRVRWLHRFDDIFNSSASTDPRRLVATELTAQVDIKNLKGKGNLLLKSELLKLAIDRLEPGTKASAEQLVALGLAQLAPDDFWCDDELALDAQARDAISLTDSGEPPKKRLRSAREALKKITKDEAASKLPRCTVCLLQRQTRLKKERQAQASGKDHPSQKLKALSLYSGADLFGLGLEEGCRVLNVKYAVELETDVATACQANRPHCTVYATPVSDFLEAAVNKSKVPTASQGEKAPPRPPNVDVILAGAPCQGFSSVNKYKKIDDIRCSEPWVYLAAMDWYRPAYSSFENVRAIQYFALPEDAEKGDLLNVLMDGLMRLGYQVRADVYNAASFGAPQVRRRLILTVALRGVPLPASPKATHAYSTAFTGMSARKYDGGVHTHVVKDCHRPHGHAQHPPVTFGDATSDLPSFGFADPYGDIPQALPSQQQWEWGQPIGFGEKVNQPYAHRLPQTAHQRAARINLGSDKINLEKDFSAVVLDHVVPPVSEKRASVLAHLGVAGEGGKKGNYLDIPIDIANPDDLSEKTALRPDLPPALAEKRYHLFWKRLGWNSILSPLRTTINPDGTSHGERIHPRDARQLSIREAARMQGFPDGIQWRDYDEDSLAAQIKMIGNAVPLPLGAALGRELFASVLAYYDKTDSLKPPPVASNATREYSRSPAALPVDRKGKGKARQISPSPRPAYYDDDSDSDSDDDLVVVSHAPARYDLMDIDDEDDADGEDSDDEELELSLVKRG